MTIEMKAAAGSAIQTCVTHLRSLGDDATQAHWNVQGMAFGPLHKLFGKVYEEGYDLRDEFAEFARALGVQINVRAPVEPLTTPIDVLSLKDFIRISSCRTSFRRRLLREHRERSHRSRCFCDREPWRSSRRLNLSTAA